MPTNDPLDKEERIRLEALNQAVQSSLALRPNNEAALIERAETFTKWIKGEYRPLRSV